MLLLADGTTGNLRSGWLRYIEDSESALEQLRAHQFLRRRKESSECFAVHCPDTTIAALIEECTYYCPIASDQKKIRVVASAERCCGQPELFGYQSSDEIYLYYPAYRNVMTFVFTFFHEYGHWLEHRSLFLNKHDWQLYAENDKQTADNKLSEKFANDFAWFCVRPSFLKATNHKCLDLFRGKLENLR